MQRSSFEGSVSCGGVLPLPLPRPGFWLRGSTWRFKKIGSTCFEVHAAEDHHEMKLMTDSSKHLKLNEAILEVRHGARTLVEVLCLVRPLQLPFASICGEP